MFSTNGIVSTFLAITLLFAGWNCACASVLSGNTSTDADPHAHHQMPSPPDSSSTDCVHQDCNDCLTPLIGVTADRDSKLASLSLTPFDEDLWIDVTAPTLQHKPLLFADLAPHFREPRPSESPVTRQDLLLE